MAASKWRGPPQRDADGDPQNSDMLPGESDHTNSKFAGVAQQLPSRAALARRFPRLRINRLSGRWVDDASGAKGDDVESLLVFLREART